MPIRKYALILAGGAILVALLGVIPPALYVSPAGKFRVGMAGRSTMDHWFKSWNWPWLVHQYAIWRSWPIPYGKYSKGDLYFELLPVPGPSFSDDAAENGREMYEAVVAQADPKRFDAIFFKFCFVDFDEKDMDDASRRRRLGRMTALVERVHGALKEKGMGLLLGTSLPVQNPTAQGRLLREEFGAWAASFGRSNPDVAVVDLYRPLVDGDGRLKPEYARRPYDDHVNWSGFRRLDRELFDALARTRPSASGGR